jgi:hypothetical protein
MEEELPHLLVPQEGLSHSPTLHTGVRRVARRGSANLCVRPFTARCHREEEQ